MSSEAEVSEAIPPRHKRISMNEKKCVSLGHAADLLDCSESGIYVHVKAGHIETIGWGADRRITMPEIERIAREGLPRLHRKKKPNKKKPNKKKPNKEK